LDVVSFTVELVNTNPFKAILFSVELFSVELFNVDSKLPILRLSRHASLTEHVVGMIITVEEIHLPRQRQQLMAPGKGISDTRI
jgi:hypothetical protein